MAKAYLTFDLETIPDIETLKKLGKIDKDISGEAAFEQASARLMEEKGSDFQPLHLHKIVVASYILQTSSGECLIESLGRHEEPESEIVRKFFGIIAEHEPVLVSWNGSGFDLPVLQYRALLHDIPCPTYWSTEGDRKWNNYQGRYQPLLCDVMEVMSRFQSRGSAPLDEIAKMLGFPGKLGMDGSQVAKEILAGNLGEVCDYCETDILNTWLVFKRLQKIKGEITDADYRVQLGLVKTLLKVSGKKHWQEFLEAWD